jgi:hypothetical protein
MLFLPQEAGFTQNKIKLETDLLKQKKQLLDVLQRIMMATEKKG